MANDVDSGDWKHCGTCWTCRPCGGRVGDGFRAQPVTSCGEEQPALSIYYLALGSRVGRAHDLRVGGEAVIVVAALSLQVAMAERDDSRRKASMVCCAMRRQSGCRIECAASAVDADAANTSVLGRNYRVRQMVLRA